MAEPLRITVTPKGAPPPPPGFSLVESNPGAPPPPPGFQIIEPPRSSAGAPDTAPPPPPGFTIVGGGGDQPTTPEQPQQGAPPPPEPPKEGMSLLDKALSPITSYRPTQKHKAKESFEQMGRGVGQLADTYGNPLNADTWKGLGNLAIGAVGYTLSPVDALVESVAGKPIQDVTGIPKEYTNFAIGLALPGLGFTKLPGAAKTWPAAARRAEEVLSPETVSQEAQDAAGLIRSHTGPAARQTETTAAQLEAFHAPVNQLPQAEQWNIQNYIDGGRTATAPATPQLRALTDTLRASLQERKAQLKSLPEYQQREFLEDYFPHMWKDPGAAADAVKSRGIGKQGSGASLKARTLPTFEDGLQAGLQPEFDSPIETTMRYVMSMDKFIASKKILNDAIDSGVVLPIRPKVMGASGKPNSLQGIPDGYTPLAGRGGEEWAAPEAWARVYNNWVSQGYEQFPTGGRIYEGVRRFTNAMTQSLLGFSGYHAFTMAEAGMSTELARAVRAANDMKPGEFVKAVGRYPTTPVRYAARGKQFKDIYLGKGVNVSPEDREIVDLITQAGGRMAGTRHALDYGASAMGDYLTAWRRAALKSQLAAQGEQIRAAPVTGTAKVALNHIARVLDTVNKPLFQHYIPSMKNGAAGELVGDWLKANPGATQAEKLAATRRIVDSVDNRFGEMIQDNIFWNKMLKQSAMVAMLSYSWNLGGWREIGGGLRDVARTAVGRQAWSPKADYVVATAINWAVLNTTYQYLKTGKAPWDTDTPILDMMAGRTGGTDQRSGKPERILVPGIMKDVFGYYEHPVQEAINKLNPGIKAPMQLLGNSDWRGDPIFAPRGEKTSMADQLPTWLGNLFEYVGKTAMPITAQNVGKREPGSGLSVPEKLVGARTAPRALADPQGTHEMLQRLGQKRWRDRMRHEARDKARYGGPQ